MTSGRNSVRYKDGAYRFATFTTRRRSVQIIDDDGLATTLDAL
jgi:hypothetical protein